MSDDATPEPEPPEPPEQARGAVLEATTSEAPEQPPPAPPPSLAPGRLWGLPLTLVGLLVPFLLMATDRRWSFSVPVGALSFGVAIAGLLLLSGSWSATAASPTAPDRSVTLGALAPRLATLGLGVGMLFAALRLAVAGVLPWPRLSAAVLVTGSFLFVVLGVARLGQALGAWLHDDEGHPLALRHRHGFWLVVLTSVLYLPMLGSYSLSDPWETHYGEVAREMLARDDWISLWWAQDGWFWSKPILNFWAQGLSFSLLGVRWQPGQMLASATEGAFPQPEWAVRLPIFLLTLLGVYFFYLGLRRAFGRRAGLLGGVVLLCLPYWYLISHQSMADMPYVAPLTAGMGLLLYGLYADPEQHTPGVTLRWRGRALSLRVEHLLLAALLLLVLPQVLYFASRNLTLRLSSAPYGFWPHWDQFFSGSGEGNCGLPGNAACVNELPRYRAPQYQPIVQALAWGALTAVFLVTNAKERRVQRWAFLGAWFFVALSAMAKGAPGLVLPLFVALVTVAGLRRWSVLPRLELPNLLLLVLLVVVPWYVAMYLRHGPPFTDRLLTHDMYKRAFVHVHDTNVGDDVSFRYYVWQLGYGLFPFTGLAAGGLLWWMRDRREPPSAGKTLLYLWFISGFAMFSVTLTKFHHYVLPVVPPLAALTGVLLDSALGQSERPLARPRRYWGGLGLGVALTLFGATLLRGAAQGGSLGHLVGAAALALLGVALSLAAAWRWGAPADPELTLTARWEGAGLGALGLGAAALVALAGRDLIVTVKGDVNGPARLMHLFTYNYKRPWPEHLSFEGTLLAFTLVAGLGSLVFLSRRWRPHAARVLLLAGVAAAAWGVNVYLPWASPHWGQRETSLAYYLDRQSPEDPFIAYQMNWKGENFYLGNRVAAFVSSGQKFKDYVEAEKKKGVRRFYVVTEHGRASSLKSELGNPPVFTPLTSPLQNNKFFVARVEF